jgi:predicted transcriptional regulator
MAGTAVLAPELAGGGTRSSLTCMCMRTIVGGMRTTIELRDDQRARLLEIAGRRGEKGFSRLIQEAVDRYLQDEARRDRSVEAALAVLGSISEREADEMRTATRGLRERWR